MSTNITITELLRNPKKVRQLTSEGLIVIVFFNGKPVFEIKAFTPKKLIKKTLLPSFKLDINDNFSKKDLYQKYGVK